MTSFLVRAALVALLLVAVRPLPVAPRQIPYHAGFVYFELDQAGLGRGSQEYLR